MRYPVKKCRLTPYATPFEWPGRIALRKAIADRQAQLADIGLEQFRAALAAAVRQKGYALYAAQQRQAATNEVTARGEELVATIVLGYSRE